MKKKGNLVSLIESLSPIEANNFLASQGNKSKTYIKLYEYISGKSDVTDADIRAHFKGQKFLDQLHVTKNHLYNALLKSLRDSNAQESISINLKNLLINVELLFKRGLYNHCYFELKKTRALASKYERNEVLLEVLKWERNLHQSGIEDKTGLQTMACIVNAEEQTIEHLSIYHKYVKFSYEALIHGYATVQIEKILQSGMLDRDVENDPLLTKVMHYHTLYVTNTLSGNPQHGIEAISTLTDELERHPHRIQEDPKPYITAINNMLGSLLYQKSYDEIPSLLGKIRNIPSHYQIQLNTYLRRAMARSFNMEMELYRDTMQIEEGMELIPKIQEFLHDNMTMLPAEYTVNLLYQFAYVNFLAQNYRATLKYANEMISGNFGNTREEIQGYSRLLTLIAHYELQNITVLKYAVDSTRRYLKKKRTLEPFEVKLLKLFSQLCTYPRSEHQDLFVKAHATIFNEMDDAKINHILDYLNFTRWFESNIDSMESRENK